TAGRGVTGRLQKARSEERGGGALAPASPGEKPQDSCGETGKNGQERTRSGPLRVHIWATAIVMCATRTLSSSSSPDGTDRRVSPARGRLMPPFPRARLSRR